MRVEVDTNGDWLAEFELVMLGANSDSLVRRTYEIPRPLDLPGWRASNRPVLPGEVAVPSGVVGIRP